MPAYSGHLNVNASKLIGKQCKQVEEFSNTCCCFVKNELCLTNEICLRGKVIEDNENEVASLCRLQYAFLLHICKLNFFARFYLDCNISGLILIMKRGKEYIR